MWLSDRQVGDTSPLAIQAVDETSGEALEISGDDEFWVDMISADGSTTAKIDHASATANRSNSVLTYAPTPTEMNTAGYYTVQFYCLRPDGERLITALLGLRLVANARTLSFS